MSLDTGIIYASFLEIVHFFHDVDLSERPMKCKEFWEAGKISAGRKSDVMPVPSLQYITKSIHINL